MRSSNLHFTMNIASLHSLQYFWLKLKFISKRNHVHQFPFLVCAVYPHVISHIPCSLKDPSFLVTSPPQPPRISPRHRSTEAPPAETSMDSPAASCPSGNSRSRRSADLSRSCSMTVWRIKIERRNKYVYTYHMYVNYVDKIGYAMYIPRYKWIHTYIHVYIYIYTNLCMNMCLWLLYMVHPAATPQWLGSLISW